MHSPMNDPSALGVRRVLVVEDSEFVHQLYRVAFRRLGSWQVAHAYDGKQGLAAVQAQRPDLVILDVQMPVMGGLEFLDALARLPDAGNIVFMAGRKFGSTGSEWLTWAMNAHVPALVAERFAQSRIVAFSTACVYPFVSTAGNGAPEDMPPTAPSGEYANSCVARERMFQHFSHEYATPGRLLRLSYAIDMRYGVLHDVAQKVLHREPIDLAMGHANVIWQGEANDWALRSLAHCDTPTSPLNLSGPKISIRDVAQRLGQRLRQQPLLKGQEADTAWLVDCSEAFRLFGPPQVSLDTMLDWTADWVQRGGASLGKPTHYEARDGKY